MNSIYINLEIENLLNIYFVLFIISKKDDAIKRIRIFVVFLLFLLLV